MVSIPQPYPLRNVTDDNLMGLAKALWGWEFCESCQRAPGKGCSLQTCQGIRWKKLESFFDYYKQSAASYIPDFIAGIPPAIKCHDDLFAIIQLLKANPGTIKSELIDAHFATDGGRCQPSISADQLEKGLQPISWEDNMSLTQFLSGIFPTVDSSSSERDVDLDKTLHAINNLVTARKLIKVARLTFVPTDDLRDHLRLDPHDGTIRLYHHTAFLKESLIASQRVAGHIPRQLAIEVLDSIQRTLFLTTADGSLHLHALVAKHRMDPDSLTFEPSTYQLEGEGGCGYKYLQPRLAILYEEIANPTPRGLFERWIEKKSGARYVMMATLGGLGIAILLGVLSLAVSIFQAWVGWQQWQHPV
ncbi:hypothetical protein B0I35DRAFT_267427 [Stachybotrys elegans]|uniref:Uncharacterized protein n=1 Tax=Stachybotrys elegans TaxID=80388 RepID=A0A8K0WRE3_9HYPO|nr:hypothetical protein B0I35DRAFT_267427 [Stachybotrys elegans]